MMPASRFRASGAAAAVLLVLASSALALLVEPAPAEASEGGLRITHYAGVLDQDPDVDALVPCLRTVGVVDFDWGEASPGPDCPEDLFSTHARGWIRSPRTGVVDFCISSDDGARLEVGGTVLVDALSLGHGPEDCNYLAQRPMKAGRWYRIDLFHNEFGGGATLQLKWTLPGDDGHEIVPASALRSRAPAARADGDVEVAPVPLGVPSGDSPSLPSGALLLPIVAGAVVLARSRASAVGHRGG